MASTAATTAAGNSSAALAPVNQSLSLYNSAYAAQSYQRYAQLGKSALLNVYQIFI